MAMKKIVYGMLVLTFVGLMSCGDAALDYSGEWAGTYTEDEEALTSAARASQEPELGTPGTLSFTINQTGSTLNGTGTFYIDDGVEFSGSFTGTVSAGIFEMDVIVDIPDFGKSAISVSGTFTSETSASGEFSGEVYFGTGTFSMTKQ